MNYARAAGGVEASSFDSGPVWTGPTLRTNGYEAGLANCVFAHRTQNWRALLRDIFANPP